MIFLWYVEGWSFKIINIHVVHIISRSMYTCITKFTRCMDSVTGNVQHFPLRIMEYMPVYMPIMSTLPSSRFDKQPGNAEVLCKIHLETFKSKY